MTEQLRCSPFQDFPTLAYEVIFRYLNLKDHLNCRLVCSEWYMNIVKIFKHPNCFSIGENKCRFLGWISMKHQLKKYLSTKCYEDPFSAVEVLNIQSLSLFKWRHCFQASNNFQGTTKNVTELSLKNVMFHNRKVLIEFLTNLDKLNLLVIHHCSFNSSQKLEYTKMEQNGNVYIDELDALSSIPKILDIELTENSLSMILILEMLNFKLKPQTLEDLKLTVLPRQEKSGIRSLYDLGFGKPENVVKFLKLVISNHSKTIQHLNIDWKISHSRWDNFNYPRYFNQIFNIFATKAVSDDDIKLRSFKLDVGRMWLFLFHDLFPFLKVQIERGLRNISLGKLMSCYGLSMISMIRVRYILIIYSGLENQPKDLQIKYDHELVVDGTKKELNLFYTWFDRVDLHSNKCLFMQRNEVKLANPPKSSRLGFVKYFREYLWNYELPVMSNDKLNYDYYEFIDLSELIIRCEITHLKSYNVSTICFLCPNLTKLKIVDGPEVKYNNNRRNKTSSHYEGMSQAVINDYDMKFIFSSLVHLKELVIWANMSAVTDTGFIPIVHHVKDNSECEQFNFDDHESYKEFAFMVNLYYKEAKEGRAKLYNYSYLGMDQDRWDLIWTNKAKEGDEILEKKRTSLASASISCLQELTLLSLRGVGDKISDEIVSECGLCGLRELRCLEILGNHKISSNGKQMLRKIKEVRLK